MKSVLVVDLATDNQYTHLWNNVQETIASGTDSLKSNYVGLDPKSFDSLPAVIIDNKIVCFSGLQTSQKKWGSGIGRCSARMWIHPEYRFKNITRFTGGDRFLNTTYSLPLQIAAATIHKLDCLFISRETNLLGFKEYLKFNQSIAKLNQQFVKKKKLKLSLHLEFFIHNLFHLLMLKENLIRKRY